MGLGYIGCIAKNLLCKGRRHFNRPTRIPLIKNSQKRSNKIKHKRTLNSPSMTPAKSENLDGSIKNAGTKWIFPSRSGCFENWLDQPPGTLDCPNVHVSPAKVETKARDSNCNWLGWEIYVLTRLRKFAASLGEAHGTELRGERSDKLRVCLSSLEAWSHTTCQGREII